MFRTAPLLALTLLPAIGGPALAQAAPPIPAPPPVILHHGAPDQPMVLMTPETDIRCGDAPVRPLYADDLPVGAGHANAAWGDLAIAFGLSAEGRPLDIRPALGAPISTAQPNEAVQAALAAWRFEPGARADCLMTVRWTPRTLDQARPDDLLRYFAVTRVNGALRNAVAARLAGPGADCGDQAWGGRRPRTVVHPDFEAGRRPPPGGRSWTVVRWNIDAEGRAADVETLGSSGDPDLDQEARRAMAETVMRPGRPVRGCVYNFHRLGPTLEAPPRPEPVIPEDPLRTCPASVTERLDRSRRPTYPRAFWDRAVEGWALVRYDVASWGQVGGVEVIEAQPARAFGDSARNAIQGWRTTPGFEAAVRCVAPMRFRLSKDEEASEP